VSQVYSFDFVLRIFRQIGYLDKTKIVHHLSETSEFVLNVLKGPIPEKIKSLMRFEELDILTGIVRNGAMSAPRSVEGRNIEPWI
jgi:hypothetical protein